MLVTGATGGVGSIAVGILKAGFTVVAATGKTEEKDFPRLGAEQVISRKPTRVRETDVERPLGRVVDTVGGNILATAIRSTKEEGALPAVAMPCRRSLR